MTPLADPWPAPRPAAPVERVVSLPGSKSLTNRALILAALADGPSVVRRPLRSRDTLLMTAGLAAMGVGVADDGDDWLITPGTREEDLSDKSSWTRKEEKGAPAAWQDNWEGTLEEMD